MDRNDFASRVVEQTNRMYRIAYVMLRNDEDCRDAMQEAALKAWEKRFTLREPQYFATWLTRILINEWDVICQGKIYLLLKFLSHNTHDFMKNSKRDSHVLSLLPYRV